MAIAFVQAASTGNTAIGNLTATFGSNVTAGNTVIAFLTSSYPSSAHTYVAADLTATDTFTILRQLNDNADTQSIGIAYTAAASAGGYRNVTFNCSSFTAGFDGLVIMEFSGLAVASNDVGASNDAHTGGSSSANGCTSGSFTTTVNGDLIVLTIVDITGTGSTYTAGTTPVTFAIPTNAQITSPGATFAAEYGVQASLGVTNPAITSSSANGYIAIGGSFKVAAGGPQDTPELRRAVERQMQQLLAQ